MHLFKSIVCSNEESILLSFDISYLVFHDIESFEFRDRFSEGPLFDRLVFGNRSGGNHACRKHGACQLHFTQLVVIPAKGNAVFPAGVIQHGKFWPILSSYKYSKAYDRSYVGKQQIQRIDETKLFRYAMYVIYRRQMLIIKTW